MSQESVSSYIWGQCTAFVAQTLGWIPAGLGNAGDWVNNAQIKGYAISNTPVAGSAVVYSPGGGYSPYGHVAVVEQVLPDGSFLVAEQNYKGPGITDERVSTMAGVSGFILPPGSSSDINLAATSTGIDRGKGANYGPAGPLGNAGGVKLPDPGAAVNAAFSNVGHGLADALAVGATDIGEFFKRQVVAFAVAAVVLFVLFNR